MSETAVVHILGCGNFGRRALAFYAGQEPPVKLFLVDPDAENLATARAELAAAGRECETVCEDAAAYLARLYLPDAKRSREWIIPTAPLHLAFAALCRVSGRQAMPFDELPLLPNLYYGERCELASSIADFLCPADCPQPRRFCYHTGQPRQPSLFKLLVGLRYPFRGRVLPSLILASTQIAPGLGGFPLRRWARLVEYIVGHHPEPLLFSTACRCHGVSNILGGK
jgi:hypothetical protein